LLWRALLNYCWHVKARIMLTAMAMLATLLLAQSPAFADDPPPPDPPIDTSTVPPLVSEPLVIPPSTTPEGDFTNCCTPYTSPDPAPPFPPIVPPPAPWLSWTPEQIAAINRLVRNGGSVSIETAPDGTLLIQDIAGYTVDNSPNPWVLMGLDGSSALLSQSPPSPIAGAAPGTDPSLRMDVPTSAGVSFVATNASPVEAMVLVTWEVGGSRVSRWKHLAPGEVWVSALAAPEGASTTTAGVLITQSTSTGGYENNMVGIVAAATNN
jgi:hypothetical protein